MLRYRQTNGIACGLIFLLLAFSSRSITADELSARTLSTQSPPTFAVKAVAETKPIVLASTDPGLVIIPSTKEIPDKPQRVITNPWPTPARFFTINEVLAARKHLSASSLQLAAIDPQVKSDASSPALPATSSNQPFGLFLFRAPEGDLWVKWRGVEADIDAEAPVLRRCSNDLSHCSPATARFLAIVSAAAKLQGRSKLELVNARVNAAIRYTTDMAQWGVPDVWSAPLDVNNKGSFDTGLGDCEDYAIAKYVALRLAGLTDDNLKLLLVRDNTVHMAHAVLAARQDGRWLILDNRWTRLIEDTELRQFLPLFALDQHGVSLFAAPYASRRLMAPRAPTIDATDEVAAERADLPSLGPALTEKRSQVSN